MVLEISIAVIVLAGVTALWLLRRKSRTDITADDLPPVPLDGSGRFRAVSIRFGEQACNASKALHGRRFLNNAAPDLPLPDCDIDDCQCRFVHHRDRRSGNDRRTPFQAGFGGSATRISANRRKQKDRRQDEADQ